MSMHRLCSTLIIIAIVASSNTQNVANKWKIEDSRYSDNEPTASANKRNGRLKSLGVEKNKDSTKQFERLLQAPSAFNEPPPPTKSADDGVRKSSEPHSRKKRLIWVSDDGRLALPPGTVLSISPTISMPLVRYPPEGFLSNLTMSFPVTIDFDKLGLTDNENPLGVLPPLFGRSMGRAAGSVLASYIGKYLHTRKRRELNSDDAVPSPKLPDEHQHSFHGGERALLYGVVEDLIGTFGLNGRACVLRTICELHSKSVHHLGLFGEMAKLFFTASKSKFSDLLPEYVRAEKVGEGSQGPGECFPYYKACPRSLFKIDDHKYSEPSGSLQNDHHQDHLGEEDDFDNVVQLDTNEIHEINDLDETAARMVAKRHSAEAAEEHYQM